LVFDEFIVGCKGKEQRMEQVDMCAVFDWSVYLHVCLSCGHGYVARIEYIYRFTCISDLFVGKKRYRHYHEQSGGQTCSRNKGGKPDLGFDIFYYHENRCCKGSEIWLSSSLPCGSHWMLRVPLCLRPR